MNRFAIQSLSRSFNECVVESEVSSLLHIPNSSRHLKDENSKKLNIISKNGPYPLVSSHLVNDMMTNYFENDRHFVLARSSYFVSKTG